MEIVLNELGLGLLLGLVALVTFFVANLFSKSLTPKSYDQVLEELNKEKGRKSPEKSPRKKAKKAKKAGKADGANDSDEDEEINGSKSKRKVSLTVQVKQTQV